MRSRYPTLATTLEDEPNVPKRNVFARNISAGGVWDDISKAVIAHQTVTHNLVIDGDPQWARLIRDADGKAIRIEFKDPAAVAALGFEPIPIEQIGPYPDPRRASWPIRRAARPVALPGRR